MYKCTVAYGDIWNRCRVSDDIFPWSDTVLFWCITLFWYYCENYAQALRLTLEQCYSNIFHLGELTTVIKFSGSSWKSALHARNCSEVICVCIILVQPRSCLERTNVLEPAAELLCINQRLYVAQWNAGILSLPPSSQTKVNIMESKNMCVLENKSKKSLPASLWQTLLELLDFSDYR